MKNILIIGCFILLASSGQELRAQTAISSTPNPDLMKKRWQTEWITCPGISLTDFNILFFRKSFKLAEKPSSFIINVSGDTRYKLYVNGHKVCFGPVKGDKYHWYFEKVDIAPVLMSGINTISAVVWNFGEWAPVA